MPELARGSDRAAHLGGDFIERQATPIPQPDHGAVIIGQASKGAVKFRRILLADRRAIGRTNAACQSESASSYPRISEASLESKPPLLRQPMMPHRIDQVVVEDAP